MGQIEYTSTWTRNTNPTNGVYWDPNKKGYYQDVNGQSEQRFTNDSGNTWYKSENDAANGSNSIAGLNGFDNNQFSENKSANVMGRVSKRFVKDLGTTGQTFTGLNGQTYSSSDLDTRKERKNFRRQQNAYARLGMNNNPNYAPQVSNQPTDPNAFRGTNVVKKEPETKTTNPVSFDFGNREGFAGSKWAKNWESTWNTLSEDERKQLAGDDGVFDWNEFSGLIQGGGKDQGAWGNQSLSSLQNRFSGNSALQSLNFSNSGNYGRSFNSGSQSDQRNGGSTEKITGDKTGSTQFDYKWKDGKTANALGRLGMKKIALKDGTSMFVDSKGNQFFNNGRAKINGKMVNYRNDRGVIQYRTRGVGMNPMLSWKNYYKKGGTVKYISNNILYNVITNK